MAASALHPKSKYLSRSNSLPSKPYTLISEFDDHLSRLRASKSASFSPSLIHNRLNGIQDLHDCVNKLLQLSFTQQALAQEQHKTLVDELLHESLRLLDLCGITKDALLQTKECTYQLQSIMRRRRKSQCTNKNQEILSVVSMLRETELVTLSVLEALLSFIAGPKLRSKSNSWWFVSKLKAHVELQFLIVHITRKSDCAVHLENIQNLLEKSESSI
ncbi:hypothetical protein ACB092_11G038700 [Castanea dentata]